MRIHRSISFDVPAAFTHLTEQLWRHELEDCMTLYQQQQQLAESRLRRHEFTTMDELLKENRDFVQSQRFYNVRSGSRLYPQESVQAIQNHLDLLALNDHSSDHRVRKFSFKPRWTKTGLMTCSTMKKVKEAAMLPTNLHINDIIIRRRTSLNNYDLETLFRWVAWLP